MKCRINKDKMCEDPVFDKIRVRVQHEDTGRITEQTWELCKLHFIQINNEPTRFYAWYRHKEANANVLEVIEGGLL